MTVNTFKTLGLAIISAALMKVSALGVVVPPNSVTFAWDASSDPIVAGYHVYQGPSSGNYTNVIDAGALTQATVSGLVTGATYYFAVTSYNSIGLESVPSNEITYTAGTATSPLSTLMISLQPNRQVVLRSTGPANYRYDVLAAQKFTNWTVIGTLTNAANGSGQFTDTAAPSFLSRSYRLRQTAP